MSQNHMTSWSEVEREREREGRGPAWADGYQGPYDNEGPVAPPRSAAWSTLHARWKSGATAGATVDALNNNSSGGGFFFFIAFQFSGLGFSFFFHFS